MKTSAVLVVLAFVALGASPAWAQPRERRPRPRPVAPAPAEDVPELFGGVAEVDAWQALVRDGQASAPLAARLELAYRFAEWFTACRVWDDDNLDSPPAAAVRASCRALDERSENGGLGPLDTEGAFAGARARLLPGGDPAPEKPTRVRKRRRPGRRSPFGLGSERERFAEQMLALLLPVRSGGTPEERRSADFVITYIGLMTTYADPSELFQRSRSGRRGAEAWDELSQLALSDVAGRLRDDVWLTLRVATEGEFAANRRIPRFAFPLAPLDGAQRQDAGLRRRAGLAFVPQILDRAQEFGVKDDDGQSLPRRLRRVVRAAGRAELARLDRTFAALDASERGDGTASATLSVSCAHRRDGAQKAPCLLLLEPAWDDDGERVTELARALDDDEMGDMYGEALGLVVPIRDPAGLTALEEAARARAGIIADPASEMPFLRHIFRGTLSAGCEAEGLPTPRRRVRRHDRTPLGKFDASLESELAACIVGGPAGCLRRIYDQGLGAAKRQQDEEKRRRLEDERELAAAEPSEPIVIPRAEMDAVLANPSTLTRQVRIVPNYRDGRYRGFKLVGIRSGSFVRKLGFRNGDTIVSINGRFLDGPERALAVFDELQRESSFDVRIERRGRPLALQIEVK